jgi:hypothetical protein
MLESDLQIGSTAATFNKKYRSGRARGDGNGRCSQASALGSIPFLYRRFADSTHSGDESHHQIHAREELAETGHPEPPHSHGAIDFGADLGIAGKSLPTPDEVAGSETEKADRDGPKWRTSERKCDQRRFNTMAPQRRSRLGLLAVPKRNLLSSSRSWRILLYQLLGFQLGPKSSGNLRLHRSIVRENLLFAAGANDQGCGYVGRRRELKRRSSQVYSVIACHFAKSLALFQKFSRYLVRFLSIVIARAPGYKPGIQRRTDH